MFTIEISYPRSDTPPAFHRCSGELSNAEILKRFGLTDTRARVTVWPEGRPDLAQVLKRGD